MFQLILSEKNKAYAAKTVFTRKLIVLAFYCIIFTFLFSVTSSKTLFRPLVLTYGVETRGMVVGKSQSLSFTPLADLLLLVSFQGADVVHSYFYPVNPKDFSKAKEGEYVTVRYFAWSPTIFITNEYKAHSKTATLLATAFLIVLLFTAMYLFFTDEFHKLLNLVDKQNVLNQCKYGVIGILLIGLVFYLMEKLLLNF